MPRTTTSIQHNALQSTLKFNCKLILDYNIIYFLNEYDLNVGKTSVGQGSPKYILNIFEHNENYFKVALLSYSFRK
jgi:hypothetical protein